MRLLLQLRALLMNTAAILSRRHGTGTGGGGGGQPVPPYLAFMTLSGATTGTVTHTTVPYQITQTDQNLAPFAGAPGPFLWTSSNPTVGTVDSTGVVTMLTAGSTNITVRTTNSRGQVITSSPAVTLVVGAQVATSPIAVTPSSDAVAVSGTKQFTAVVSDQGTPPNVISGASVSWDTSDHSKATISAGGLATGVGNTSGTPVTITATSGSATGTATLAVTASSSVTAVTALYSNVAKGTLVAGPCLFFGGTTYPLAAQDQSGNALSSAVGSWSVTGTGATIAANGVVTPTGIGAPTFTYTHTATGLTGTITATTFPTITWLKQEPVSYLTDSDLRANIGSSVTTGNHTPPGTGGSGALYQDGLNESAVTLDTTRPFMGNATLLMTLQTGSIPILRTGAFANQSRIWSLCLKRYDTGFNTGAPGAVPPAFSYKDGPYLGQLGPSGRSGHLYTSSTSVESECNILSGGSEVGGSSETTIGNITNEWISQQWILDLQLYEVRSGRIMSQRLWRCLVGENPSVTNRLSNQQVEGAVQVGFSPLQINYISAFGENFNRSIVGQIYKSIGRWGVVSGVTYGDPFGVLGTQATPTLTGISGGTVQPGDTSKTVTLTGTNFNANCYPVFSNSGVVAHYSGDKISNLTVTATQITYVVDCLATATPDGGGTVTVYNAASQVATAPQVFTVGSVTIPQAPTLSNATTVNNQTLTFPYTLNAAGGVPDSLTWQYRETAIGGAFIAGGSFTLVSPALGGSGNAQFILPKAATGYDVQAAATNAGGTSAYSSTVTGTTGAAATLISTGLAVDWNPDTGTDVTTDGAGVGSLIDTIASATIFQGTPAKKPILKLAVYNGHNCIRFTAASFHNLTANAVLSALNSVDGTLYLVAKNSNNTPGSNQRLFANYNFNGGSNVEGYFVNQSSGNTTVQVIWGKGGSNGNQGLTLSTAMTIASGAHSLACVFDHTTPAETPYFDGLATTAGGFAFVRQTTAPSFPSIGSDKGSANFWDGDFIRFLWYNTIHTPAQVAQNSSYLKTLYNLP